MSFNYNQHRTIPRLAATLVLLFFLAIVIPCATAQVACPLVSDKQIAPYIGEWHGTLDDESIAFYLEPHYEDRQRLQGYYIYTSTPDNFILIVAEQMKGYLEVEESNDGTNISGLWALSFPEQEKELSRCYTKLEGEWLDINFENPKHIILERKETLSW